MIKPLRLFALIALISYPAYGQDSNLPPNIADLCPQMTIEKIGNVFKCKPPIADSLEKIIKDMQVEDLRSDPFQAGDEGDREALRHLPDASHKAALDRLAAYKALVKRYKLLDAQSFKGEAKLNYQLLGYTLGQKILLAEHDPERIPFTNDSGFFNTLSYVSRQTRFAKPEDYEAYAARLSELPRYFEQNIKNMRRGIRTGFTASKEIMPGILAAVENLGAGSAKEHAFYKPFTQFPDTISKSEQARLRVLGEKTVQEKVLPAYQDLATFLNTEYMPAARKEVGIGSTPDGRAYYKAAIKYFTTLELDPEDIHQTGLNEVARIRGEMDAIIKETGFKGDFNAFLKFLRTDPQFYAKTPEDLLKTASWIAKRIDGKMPQYFHRLPRLPYGVMAVPEEMAKHYTTGRYWGGNLEKGLAGFYVVNTYDLSQRPLYNLPSLTLHEGVPGHHHQISLAQELKNVPKFRQNLYPNAFGEGWGLYSEKLGEEMGIYQTPYEHFGRLTYEMWRACRLVVDTGMHWKGWTRAQAEQCFYENSALAPHNIRTEVERYISWPGQALAYKIGELKILELRHYAEQTLGDKFDLREFHDEVLKNGGVPLDILDAQIKDWVAQKSN